MIDYLSLGPTPTDEKCEQLGPTYNPTRSRAECRAFINQLQRVFGEPPMGAGFRIKSNSHDFGTYHDVEVGYSDEHEDAMAYAFKVEDATPAVWDEAARQELGL